MKNIACSSLDAHAIYSTLLENRELTLLELSISQAMYIIIRLIRTSSQTDKSYILKIHNFCISLLSSKRFPKLQKDIHGIHRLVD